MAFSTETQLQNNVSFLKGTYSATSTPTLTAFCTERIGMADKIVQIDLANYIDFSKVAAIGDDPPTPDFINLLSQYKAAELSCARARNIKRSMGEIDDLKYYQDEYNRLLTAVKMGAIKLEDEDGNDVSRGTSVFVKPDHADVTPYFGYGKYGEAQGTDDLEDARAGGLEDSQPN